MVQHHPRHVVNLQGRSPFALRFDHDGHHILDGATDRAGERRVVGT
jgi:hypothetical protein